MQKIKVRYHSIPEILRTKEYSNLTGHMVFFYTLSFAEPQEPQKRTTRNKRTTGTFILDHFQSKLMTSFSLKVQKPCFRAIFTFLDIFPKT